MVPAPSSTRTPSFAVESPIETDRRAMTVATALFFMVGFITCLNDVIIPHLKSIFELTYAEAMLVQFAFFSSYFVFSYPGGKVVDWLGYKRAMVIGLLIMSAGAIGFLPAASYAAFPIFLIAVVILAAGMTTGQVAANPYVTIIGPAATASSRLNIAQAFNSVGTFIAPFFGWMLILRGAKPISPQRLHSMAEVARQAYRTTEVSSVRAPGLPGRDHGILPGGSDHSGTWSFGHVRFARRRYLQLHHVPVHLHPGHSGAWPAHQQGFQPDDRSHCWRSRYSTHHWKTCGAHWLATGLSISCTLLRLYRWARPACSPQKSTSRQSNTSQSCPN